MYILLCTWKSHLAVTFMLWDICAHLCAPNVTSWTLRCELRSPNESENEISKTNRNPISCPSIHKATSLTVEAWARNFYSKRNGYVWAYVQVIPAILWHVIYILFRRRTIARHNAFKWKYPCDAICTHFPAKRNSFVHNKRHGSLHNYSRNNVTRAYHYHHQQQ